MPQLPFGFQKGKKPTEPEGPRILSVSEVGRRLRADLERRYARVLVSGEISNFRVYQRSGHAYFNLKDRHATLNCVLWAEPLQRLRFRPADGQEVVANGRISYYGRQGSLQLVVESLEPRGVGALQLEYQQRLEKLRSEGLLDPKHRRPLPVMPRCIGIVTSRDGAALRDIVRTAWRRDPQAHLLLSPTVVQGRSAAFHIVRALKRLQQTERCDVIIVARGGGSLEDLWAFNEEPVARAIHECPVPVVVGVGHESDVTLAELVADMRASTPTAAAEQAVTERPGLERKLAQAELRLQRSLRHRVDIAGRRLALARGRLINPLAELRHRRAELEDLHGRAERALRQQTERRQRRFRAMVERLRAARPEAQLRQQSRRLQTAHARLLAFGPAQRVQAEEQRLQALQARLHRGVQANLQDHEQRFRRTIAQLEALSPLSVLARGYAVARVDGRVVRRPEDAPPGTEFELTLSEGQLKARSIDS